MTSMSSDASRRLLLASIKGDVGAVEELLARKADVNVRDEVFNRTPLHWAAANECGDDEYAATDYAALVKLLLKHRPNLECEDGRKRTPLLCAAAAGHYSIVRLLLGRDAGDDGEVNGRNYARVDASDGDGRTSLSWAAEQGYSTIVMLLLKEGANIESADNSGRTPLSWAVWNGREAMVELLLRERANIDAQDKIGWTPLLWAVVRRHETIVEFLLWQGAETEKKDKENGWTPLWWAARMGHMAIFQQLLKRKADVNSKDTCGQTLLAWAIRNGVDDVAQFLSEERAQLPSTI